MKTCFRCGQTKPLSEFYKHAAMADGHLGKCKECTKDDVHAHRIAHPGRLRAYEKIRTKRPERKEQKRAWLKNYRKLHPEKNIARQRLAYAVRTGKVKKTACQFKGCTKRKVEAHHEDYGKPLEVIWYCHTHHRIVEGRIARTPWKTSA